MLRNPLAPLRNVVHLLRKRFAEEPTIETACGVLERQVKRTPDAKALTFEGQTLTYAQLNERANRLAHYLRKRGARPAMDGVNGHSTPRRRTGGRRPGDHAPQRLPGG